MPLRPAKQFGRRAATNHEVIRAIVLEDSPQLLHGLWDGSWAVWTARCQRRLQQGQGMGSERLRTGSEEGPALQPEAIVVVLGVRRTWRLTARARVAGSAAGARGGEGRGGSDADAPASGRSVSPPACPWACRWHHPRSPPPPPRRPAAPGRALSAAVRRAAGPSRRRPGRPAAGPTTAAAARSGPCTTTAVLAYSCSRGLSTGAAAL